MPAPSSPPPAGSPALRRRASQSSDLPPSSPPAGFSDTDESLDERDAVGDIDEDAEGDGEDLFGENLEESVLSLSTFINPS